MSLYCLDANIFIGPWERDYPQSIFPTLWEKISEHKESFIVIKNIFDEIDPLSSTPKGEEWKKKHPLRAWLIDNHVNPVPITKEVEAKSLLLEQKYQIKSGVTKGASQNDMILVTYAKENQKVLVTLESRQNSSSFQKHNYKIPLICQKEEVECINYVDFLGRLEISI